MKRFAFAFVCALVAGAPAAFACTAQEVQTKAQAFVAKYQELAQKDAAKAQALSPKIQEGAQMLQTEMQKNPNDLSKVCKFYDDLIAEMAK